MRLSLNVDTEIKDKKVKEKLQLVLFKSMMKMHALATQKCPVDTGRLRASLKVEPMSSGYSHYNLVDGVDYGAHVEYGCYSEDTEILTKRGWKTYNEATEQDEVLVYDQETSKLNYRKPDNLIIKNYKGNMINFRNQKCDLLVTPNHRMLKYRKNWDNDFEIKKIVEAKTKWDTALFRIPRTGEWEGKKVDKITIKKHNKNKKITKKEIDMKDFLRFAGLYVAEGCLNIQRRYKRVEIYQKDKIEKVEKIIRDIGLHYFSDKDKKECIRFMISIYDLAEKMKKFGEGVYNKKIPFWVKELDVEYLKAFMEGYLLGNGSENRKFFTTSEQLKDDLMEVAVKIGKGCMVNLREENSGEIRGRKISGGLNYIGYLGRDYLEFHKGRCGKINDVDYNGKVWDYYINNKCVVTRRNGKIAISGNTSPHYTSPQNLQDWSRRVLGDESASFAVAHEIAQEGVESQPFMRPSLNEVKQFHMKRIYTDVMKEE